MLHMIGPSQKGNPVYTVGFFRNSFFFHMYINTITCAFSNENDYMETKQLHFKTIILLRNVLLFCFVNQINAVPNICS